MRIGLRARFLIIVVLSAVIALIAVVALHGQVRAHEDAVAAAVRAMPGAVDSGSSDAPATTATLASLAKADQEFRRHLALTIFVLGLLAALAAGWVWYGLVQPVLRVAATARRIEAGEPVGPIAEAQREDEIGDVASAFDTLDDAVAALRERMQHDAADDAGAALAMPPPASAPPAPARAPLARADVAGVTGVMKAPVVAAPAVPAAAPAPLSAPPRSVPTAAQVERLNRLEADLQDAWRREELRVLYQPIHSLADGSMRGAEALLRWQHPEEGAIAPAEFIALAERSDLIVELGRQVLVQACSDAGLWPSDGTSENSPFVSVNVAAGQLRDRRMFEYVVEALRKSGLAATRLHLEVPVAALREDDIEIEAALEQIRGLGAQIWLDASGTDAADAQRWMKPWVSGIKVGQGHIRGRNEIEPDPAATHAIVANARALRIVAVVVGVEQLAELNVLKEQGAELAQGYVLCKPVDTGEIGRRLLA